MTGRQTEQIIVVGAGAAGLMAAIWAAAGSRPVLLLEGSDRPGQKILISGGGRFNVLPSRAKHTDFHTDGSPNTVKKILAAWPLPRVLSFFQQDLDVPLILEEETGKLFPESNRARTVLDALLAALHDRKVKLRTGARLVGLEPAGDGWRLSLDDGEHLHATAVILATGGLSVPAMGSDGTGLNLARALGHHVVPTYPALAPLTTSSAAHKALAGLSLTATVAAERDGRVLASSRGGFLFTHRGYSGPAVLNISHVPIRSTFVGGPRPAVRVAWTDVPAAEWDERLRTARGSLAAALRTGSRDQLPDRLMALLLGELNLSAVMADQLRREDRGRLVEALTHYALPWSGHEGYRVAEVTGGGVALDEVDPVTLESHVAPGLYLCGEMLDAFGPIGGYNFLWAWVTGKIAGQACGR
jgi:predicted Rossmann fold flavoprotein